MGHRSNCKIKSYKTFRRKHRIKCMTFGVGDTVLSISTDRLPIKYRISVIFKFQLNNEKIV